MARRHTSSPSPDRDATPVRAFPSFTGDLERLAEWLTACGITSVALEATGVYWIPLFEILDARGFTVRLVNARHVTNVPGRKSDVSDCEWLRDLHMVGLLRGSFRPADGIVALRAYLRHRASLVASASAHVQRMQKALVQMNVQLPLVVSDITGVTGLRMLRDIVAGERDPHHLAQHRDYRCRASEAEIVAALTGNYRPEHVFVLQQHLQLFDTYHQQLAAYDQALEAHLTTLVNRTMAPTTPLWTARPRQRPARTNHAATSGHPCITSPAWIARRSRASARTRRSGCSRKSGRTCTAGPPPTTSPRGSPSRRATRSPGGRLLSSRTQPSANRAAAILRLTAMSVGRTETALGAFYRRLAYRVGKAKAITATARKPAILVYRVLKGELVHQDPGADAYDAHHRTRVLQRLRKRAAHLGLVDLATGALIEPTVS